MGGGKSVFLEKLNSNIGCFEIKGTSRFTSVEEVKQ